MPTVVEVASEVGAAAARVSGVVRGNILGMVWVKGKMEAEATRATLAEKGVATAAAEADVHA